MFQQTQAPYAKQMIAEARRRREPIPPPFDNPPGIPFGLEIFVTAFWELDKSRDPSTEPSIVNRITRKQMRDWLEWHGWHRDTDFADELAVYVTAIDDAFIPIERKRREIAAKREAKRRNKHGAKS